MIEQKRIRIVSNGRAGMDGGTHVYVDGVDVTDSVTHVTWSLGVDYVSRATITFAPAELEVEFAAEVRETSATVVPAEYFDQLVADLDAPDEPNEPTREAARRLRDVVRSDETADRERIVHENPEFAQQIREGIAEAEAGQTVSLGSFAQYLDDEEAARIKTLVDQLRIKASGPHADSEEDHGTEDAIYFNTLKGIAEGLTSDPQACAAEAIKAAEIEFSRWYA